MYTMNQHKKGWGFRVTKERLFPTTTDIKQGSNYIDSINFPTAAMQQMQDKKQTVHSPLLNDRRRPTVHISWEDIVHDQWRISTKAEINKYGRQGHRIQQWVSTTSSVTNSSSIPLPLPELESGSETANRDEVWQSTETCQVKCVFMFLYCYFYFVSYSFLMLSF